MASMEHPIFSLSTKPDLRIRRYEHGDRFVEIKPSVIGLATIHDRDILIYCISQLVAGLKEGRELTRTIRFKAYDLLTATNRMINGQGYEGLKAALERLRGTMISTNIITGGQEQLDIFGLIDKARIVRETREGRMQDVEVTLSEWVFNAIKSHEVLTLHRDYFRLRKPLERRMYELARKHCGHQAEWRVSLETLQKKCGSSSTSREFRRLVKSITDQDALHRHMPDYAVTLNDTGEMVLFRNRRTMPDVSAYEDTIRPLDPEAYNDARTVASGWDVRYLETEWRRWCAQEEIMPKRPEAHYLAFCKSWYERRGRPS